MVLEIPLENTHKSLKKNHQKYWKGKIRLTELRIIDLYKWNWPIKHSFKSSVKKESSIVALWNDKKLEANSVSSGLIRFWPESVKRASEKDTILK